MNHNLRQICPRCLECPEKHKLYTTSQRHARIVRKASAIPLWSLWALQGDEIPHSFLSEDDRTLAFCACLAVSRDHGDVAMVPGIQIAMKELREKKIPFTIRRYLPDGSYEDWAVHELIVVDNR